MKRNALVICIHDGLGTHYCGVGTAMRKTIESLKILEEQGHLDDFEIHIVTHFYDHEADYFDKKYFDGVDAFIRSTGGTVHEIKLLKGGKKPKTIGENWGRSKWYRGSKGAARIISELKNENIIFLAHDIAFAPVCWLVPNRKNISGYFTPHSTGMLFKEPVRLPIDRKTFRTIEKRGYKVCYVSEFMREHLSKDYGVPAHVLVPLKNALVLPRDKRHIKNIDLRQYGVDPDKRMIFSYGRCSPQKSFGLVINAFKKSSAYGKGYQLVLLAPVDITSPSYSRMIARLIGSMPKNACVWIKKFVDPRPFLRNKNLDTVVLASQFECAPYTPVEACFYPLRPKILYSNIKAFDEILSNVSCALKISDFKLDSWVTGLNTIILRNGSRQGWKPESYEKNLLNFLKDLA